MADFVGTLMAYSAFRTLPTDQRDTLVPGVDYTSDQQFFVSRCFLWCGKEEDEQISFHVHPRFRCNVPLMNMPKFARAFHCAAGSPMSPDNKCGFW